MTEQAKPLHDVRQLDRIARTVHEALSAWRVANGHDALTAWDDVSIQDRQSTYDSVQHVITHPEATAADQHDQWMRQKENKGWVFGEERDDVRKRHPMLRPFEELPDYERRKDVLLNAIVRALHSDDAE